MLAPGTISNCVSHLCINRTLNVTQKRKAEPQLAVCNRSSRKRVKQESSIWRRCHWPYAIFAHNRKTGARKANLTYSYKRLFEPEYSIQLSSLYLRELREQFNNNRALASAAYNAGPHRLKQWLATLQQDLPLDAWIETIPFNETRQYVKNVLSFSLIYQALHTGNKAPEKQLKNILL